MSDNKKEYLGFEQQDTAHECGGYSVRHGLLMFGKLATRSYINTEAPVLSSWQSYIDYGTTNEAGASPEGIKRVIRKLNYIPEEFSAVSEAGAKIKLDSYLKRNIPIILYVSYAPEDHWIVAIGIHGNKYLIADSCDNYKYPKNYRKAVSWYTWEQLIQRWYEECECNDGDKEKEVGEIWCEACDGYGTIECQKCNGKGCRHCRYSGEISCANCRGIGVFKCKECDGKGYLYYGIAIRPTKVVYTNHNAMMRVPSFADKLIADSDLAEYWGYFLSDLIDSFGDPSLAGKNTISALKFFNLYEDHIIQSASYWLAGMQKDVIVRELSRYQLVAQAYDMKFSKAKLDEVLIDFTMAFTMTLADWYVF